MKKVMVLEDESSIRSFIVINLRRAGYDVIEAETGEEALDKLKENPDTRVALLDIMLPVMDGWSVCAKIRETSKVPIIMLTAKGEVFDRIQGLEMGADDYVVKPFEMKELIARINAVLRRTEIPNDTSKRLTFDKLVIDLDSYELIVDGKKIDTPPKELELLYHLAPPPTGCTPGTSCWMRCGALTTSATAGQWMSTSASIDVQLRTSEHRSMYSYVRLSIDRCTATYV